MVDQKTAASCTRVPPLCPGGTVVCLACGPSLTAADVNHCRGKATVLAINDSWRLAPWADALIASDAAWWHHHRGASAFPGLKFSLDKAAASVPGVVVLKNTGDKGIELDPTGLRTGRNTGAAAINLAVHFGATRIILLGYDMEVQAKGPTHWFGDHPLGLRNHSPYPLFRQMIATMADPLRDAGVEVINCSRHTALDCFPCRPLDEVLP